jgi:hypothetical protein
MIKKVVLVLGFFAVLGIGTSQVYALTVSPARLEVTADPGQTLRGEIEIFNEQSTPRTFYTSYENFEPRGDSGAPYFVGAQDGLATWIQTQSEVTLQPGERATIPYAISVPAGTEPGGYFAAIFFGDQPPGNGRGGEVSIGGKIGILVLLRVAGDIPESGGLADFDTQNGGNFFSSLPITFTYRVSNGGGDRIVPLGEVRIKNMFGLTTATLAANETKGSVLPGSARKFSVLWGESVPGTETSSFLKTVWRQLTGMHIGWYRATVDVTWGQTNQKGTASLNFFVIPWQLLSIVFGVLLFVWFVLRVVLGNYKRRIIAQAMQQAQQ